MRQQILRDWAIAKQTYDANPTDAIIQQCRCALLTAQPDPEQLNLPVSVVIALLRQNLWGKEKLAAYIDALEEDEPFYKLIQQAKHHTPEQLSLEQAAEKAKHTQSVEYRAWIFRYLAEIDRTYLNDALEAFYTFPGDTDDDDYARASFLIPLVEGVQQAEAQLEQPLLDAIRSISHQNWRIWVLEHWAKLEPSYWPEVVTNIRALNAPRDRAIYLAGLAELDSAYETEAVKVAQTIKDEHQRTKTLCQLGKKFPIAWDAALAALSALKSDDDNRAFFFSDLACAPHADRPTLTQLADELDDVHSRAIAWKALAQADRSYLPNALAAVRALPDHARAGQLISLLVMDPTLVPEALADVQTTADEPMLEGARCGMMLNIFSHADPSQYSMLLNALDILPREQHRAAVLSAMASRAPAGFLAQLRPILQGFSQRERAAKVLSSYLPQFTEPSLEEWHWVLHLLAERDRQTLMQDLLKLSPAIIHLGGETALQGVATAIEEVAANPNTA